VSCAQMAEPICHLGGPTEAQVQSYSPGDTSVPSWGRLSATWRIRLNHPSAMAMRLMSNYFDHLLSLTTPN